MRGRKGVPGSPGHCEAVYLNLRSGAVARFTLPKAGGGSIFAAKDDQYAFEIGQGVQASFTTGKVSNRTGTVESNISNSNFRTVDIPKLKVETGLWESTFLVVE